MSARMIPTPEELDAMHDEATTQGTECPVHRVRHR